MSKLLVANVPAIICYGAACALAVMSISGWGWFLFVGLLCTQTFKSKEEE